jgi:AcrR family transcriptional regulator
MSQLTAKGRATKARIVATAADLVFKQGVAGTSIEDVRKAAGVSGSQMTHYFEDKKALIRAVVTHQADTILATHQELGNLDSFDALDAWANLNIRTLRLRDCEGGCVLGSLAAEVVECDAQARANAEQGFERWEAVLREGLTAMRERGDLRAEADPDQLALALLAAVQGGALLTQARRDVAPLEAALRVALAHVRSLAA